MDEESHREVKRLNAKGKEQRMKRVLGSSCRHLAAMGKSQVAHVGTHEKVSN